MSIIIEEALINTPGVMKLKDAGNPQWNKRGQIISTKV